MKPKPVLLALALAALPAPMSAQGSGAYVVRIGTDTVAVDRFARDGQSLTGTLVLRSPATHVARYRAELGPDDAITRFSVDWSAPAAGTATPDDAVLVVRGDSTTITFTSASGETRSQSTALPAGTVPLVHSVYSIALYDWGVHHTGDGRSGTVSWLSLDRRRPSTADLTPRGRDSVAFPYFAGTYVARVDEGGRILGLTGKESTAKIEARLVADTDIEALVADFAARDAAGKGLGAMSPRDTMRATLGSAEIVVDYSRPHARGRDIWGGVVPWGEVWRTGANAATTFTTSADLLIGGQRVPAGTYTVFTLPERGTTQLIINRQTGQWGTQHDPERDLVRIPLRHEPLSTPVEQFTIAATPRGDGGVFSLAWGDARYAADISVP